MKQYLFILLYFVVSILNIYACIPPVKHRLRAVTKCFLMPLLALVYMTTAKAFSPLVFFAILCGFAGDVFLLGKEKSWPFAAGLVSFAIGHVLYSCYIWSQLPAIPNLTVFIVAAVLLLAGTGSMFRLLWPRLPKLLFAPCLIYMLIISFMCLSALMYAVEVGGPLGWMASIGAVLFIISDSALSISTFRKRIPGRYLVVMSTYITAQTLLVLSFAFTGGLPH